MATQVDLEIEANAEFTVTFKYCNPLPNTTPPQPDPGNPIDVTGWSAYLTAKGQFKGRTLVELTVGQGIVVGGTNGEFVCTMSADQTAALADGVYDVLGVPPGGGGRRIAQGNISVSPGVSAAAG